MKYLPTIFLFVAIGAFGSNYCVNFHSSHEWLPDGYVGAITNVGESAEVLAGWHTNWTGKQLQAHMDAMRPAYEAALSNRNWQAEAPTRNNIKALQGLYDDLAAYERFCQASNPSAAQVGLQVRKINGVLFQLGPVLKDLYLQRPE